MKRAIGKLVRLAAATLLLTGLLLPVTQAQEDSLTLNFKDVEISALVGFVAEETGRNFIVDPRVRGRITLISGSPVSRDELYGVFLSILQVHGFAAVESSGMVRILPDALAKQSDVPMETSPPGSLAGDYVTRVVSLDHVDAAQMVPLLRPLMPQSAHLAASVEANALVIADTAGNVSRMLDIIRRIDQDSQDETEVIVVRHASASELVSTIQALEAADGRQRPPAARRLHLHADERSNSILLAGDPRRRLALRALIAHLDVPVDGGNTQVIALHYAQAEEVAEVLRGLSGTFAGAESEAGRPGNVHIQPHASTNALVINAPTDVLRDMRAVIRQLDVRRAQVLVEAVIAEVTTETARELGVQWVVGSERHGIGIINFGAAQPSLVSIARGWLSGDLSGISIGDGLSLGAFGESNGTTIGALITALAQDSSSNILSTPSVLTLDNEESEIIVGQNVPFRSGRAIEQSGQAFDTIQRQDVGVKLIVRPQINEGNAVRLEIEQEVSQVAPSVEDAADLITNKRSLRTRVMVDDGQIVVLGGLIDDVITQGKSKVPGLGDLPGVGRLFRYDRASVRKVNLMIFLRPVIVRDPATQARLTADRYRSMQARQRAARDHGALVLGRDTLPVMPDLDDLLYLPPPFSELQAGQRDISIQPPPRQP